MNGLFIKWNLGLGDAVICNAIVRHYATKYEIVVIPVKHQNVPSVGFMFRDLDNVLIRGVEDDGCQLMFAQRVWKGDVLDISCFNKQFDPSHFDQSFYRLANLPFDLRWSGWKCVRDQDCEIQPSHIPKPNEAFAFVHDDYSRGFAIRPEFLPVNVWRPSMHKSRHIFEWWTAIELASEIHCISSCFALFIDSIDLPKNPKLFLHAYCRPGEALPEFRKDWKVIR